MANEAARAEYDKQAKKAKDNADIAYNLALGNLGRQYGVANRRLESNLEARGILRSGEGNYARTEMTAEEEAAKANAQGVKDMAYNAADGTLAQQLAALLAGERTSGGGSTGGGGNGVDSTPEESSPATPSPYDTTPRQPGDAPRFPRPAIDFSGIDFSGLGKMMAAAEAKKNKPVLGGRGNSRGNPGPQSGTVSVGRMRL